MNASLLRIFAWGCRSSTTRLSTSPLYEFASLDFLGACAHAPAQLISSRAAQKGVYFKQFLHDETGCASYFLASRESREAAVIDPQLDTEPYVDLAAEREYRITDVIDTHLHADHISGNRKLAE